MASSLLTQQALAAYQQGDLGNAEQWAKAALKAEPRNTQALLVYGIVMNAGGHYSAAADAFRTLTRLQPREPVHWMNLATAERSVGSLDAAASGYARSAQLGGWTVDLHYNVALLALQRGLFSEAREHLAQAVSTQPVDAEIACRYAQILMQSGEPASLREALRGWQLWQNWTAELLAEVAMLLLTVGEQPSALGIIERLSLDSSNSLSVEMQLIAMLERTNKMDEALRRLAQLDQPGLQVPPELRSRWMGLRAQLAGRTGQPQQAIELYQEMLRGEVSAEESHEILFPLAKELDNLGQAEAAFEAATQAHVSQMAYFQSIASGPGDRPGDPPDLAMTSCDSADIARWDASGAPATEDSPVFIVAFPRSGTTLLEQMLDAHPDLQSMDEQRFLLDAQEHLHGLGVEYPAKLAEASPAQLELARQHYWAQVSTKVQLRPGQRLLDKNPLNMQRLPLIQRLWPNAPILLAIRHPFDVITSNYFQHYRSPDFARLCRDLPSLASAYAQMFDHWYGQADLLQPKVFEVLYEHFVSDFEGQTRQIAAFCGLSWHDAMLEPSKHAQDKGYIGTPSYDQVVRPVNAKAVGRWRRHASQLMPLRPKVAHLLHRWGYSA